MPELLEPYIRLGLHLGRHVDGLVDAYYGPPDLATEVDAALMLHEEGRSPAEAQSYVERWALASPERAAHTIRFVTDPTWRAYAIT